MKRSKLLVAAGVILVALVFLATHLYKRHAVISALAPLCNKASALNEEILVSVPASRNMTYGEYFEKTKKNIELREDVLRDVRILPPYRYKAAIDSLIELLQLQNELVRTQSGQAVHRMRAGSQWEFLQGYKPIGYFSESAWIDKQFRDLNKERDQEIEGAREASRLVREILLKERAHLSAYGSIAPLAGIGGYLAKSGNFTDILISVRMGAFDDHRKISEVIKGGPLDKAGAKVGDTIAKIEYPDRPKGSTEGLATYVGRLDVTAERDGKEIKLKATIK